MIPISDFLGSGGMVICRKYCRNISTPKLVSAEPKNTGDNLPCFWNAATLDMASKQIINLGGTIPYTINNSIGILSNIIGYFNIVHKEARHEVKWAVPTFQKSIDILGFEHKTSLEDGLKQMWEWAKKQPKRDQYKWPSYEITDKIYSYWK